MNNARIANLRDCSQFRQTLLARPPAFVHGTAILLVTLITTGVVWASLTQADLVVRAPGRVRPENRVFQVFVPESIEKPGYSVGGQVQEVLYKEGDAVTKNQVLLRLNTELLDEERAKVELTIETCKVELARLDDQRNLLAERFDVESAKAQVELLKTEEEIQQAKQTRAIEIRRADAEYRETLVQEQRLTKLHSTKVVTDFDLEQAQLKVRQAKASLELAEQPIQERKIESLRRAVELVEREYALQCKELELARTAKQAQFERAEKEQAALERERQVAQLRSPIDGIVTSKEVKSGDVLERGAPVVEVVEQGVLHFEATVPNREARDLRQGMPVRIKLDAYDHQWYGTLPGKVAFISPDSRAAADGKGNQVGYEVRITLERHELRRGDLRGEVKLGLTGTAEIVTDRKSILSILRKNIRRSISLG